VPRSNRLTSKRLPHLERGLGLLHRCRESDRDGREIDLHTGISGLSANRQRRCRRETAPICGRSISPRAADSPQQRFDALYGVWQST